MNPLKPNPKKTGYTRAMLIVGWSLLTGFTQLLPAAGGFYKFLPVFFLWAIGLVGIFHSTRHSPLNNVNIERTLDESRISDLLHHAIVETSPDSVFVIDLLGNIIFCSKQTSALHQYPDPKELIGRSAFKLLPYREAIRALRLLRKTGKGITIKNIELNMSRKDGSRFPAELSASLIKDNSGSPIAYLAIARDITERKWMEVQIHETESLYRIVADNTYDLEFWQAPNNRFIYISPSCKRISGYDDIEFISDSSLMEAIVHPDDRVDFLAHRHETHIDTIPREIEFRIIRKHDHSVRWINHVCQPVFDKKGKHLGTRGSNRDITEKKLVDDELRNAYEKVRTQLVEIEKLQATLREQVIRDSLTGLFNRRYLEEALKQEHARALREGHRITVVMLDMDHLKTINDNKGHILGDKALILLGEQFKTMTRVEDIACRYGGDEFLIILHNMAANDAYNRVEEWRRQFERKEIFHEGQTFRTTFTAGIASYPALKKNMEEILHAADMALYQAKLKGRNTIILVQESDQS